MKIFINGKISSEPKAKLSIFDRGFLYGDGLFETMRSYNGKIFRLNRHLKRLYEAAKIIKLDIPVKPVGLKKAVYRLLRLNRLKNAYIRVAISRGEGRVGLDATTVKSSNIVIITKEFHPYPERFYKNGLHVGISKIRRNEESILSRIKSLNYLNNILARIEVQRDGFNDAILLNNKGKIACGAVSNIFLIKGKSLLTPSRESGILPGITREEVIKIAPKAGFKVREKEISIRELFNADEVFFTNTLMEILPVTRINKRYIGNGRVGDGTKTLHRNFHR